MNDFVNQNFAHFLCAAVLLARLGDVGTTLLATPTLKLEANPIAKKLGWGYALLTLLTCLLAYCYTGIAVMILSMSLMVSASNASKIYVMRTLGEEEFRSLQLKLMAKSGLMPALLFSLMPAVFYLFLAGVLMFFDRNGTWGFCIAEGIISYSIAILIFYPIGIVRLWRKTVNSRTGEVGIERDRHPK